MVTSTNDLEANNEIGMALLNAMIGGDSKVSELRIVHECNPDKHTMWNDKDKDGNYFYKFDKKDRWWGQTETNYRDAKMLCFDQDHVKQIRANVRIDLPSWVPYLEFMYENERGIKIQYHMFLKQCGGKFALFNDIGVPYDGSSFLRIRIKSDKTLSMSEVPWSKGRSNRPRVASTKYPDFIRFYAHRMVLYLWGGPNNSFQEMNDSLEGDHIENDIFNYCIWYLQWLTSELNKEKERKLYCGERQVVDVQLSA